MIPLARAEKPTDAAEAFCRVLEEEQVRQACQLEIAESRLEEEMRTCKNAIVNQDKRIMGLHQDQSALRRAVVALRLEVMTAVRTELRAHVQKEIAATKTGLDEIISAAVASAIAVCLPRKPGTTEAEKASQEWQPAISGPLEHQGKRSRSPKKRLGVMQPLQEVPDEERLEKLDEAIEREKRSRAELEQRLEGHLHHVSDQVQSALALLHTFCEESKVQEAPVKDSQAFNLQVTMRNTTTSSHRMLDSPDVAPQPDLESVESSKDTTKASTSRLDTSIAGLASPLESVLAKKMHCGLETLFADEPPRLSEASAIPDSRVCSV